MASSLGFCQGTVVFEANISNRNSDTLYIKDYSNMTIKEIVINEEGKFFDKFDVENGFYVMFDGVEYAQLYLKSDFDLKLKMDAKQFDETIFFDGIGANENNFLAEQTINQEIFLAQNFEKSKEDFYVAFDAKKKADFEKLENGGFDEIFYTQLKNSMTQEFSGIQMEYDQAQKSKKLVGKPSASFNYLNHAGGKTKLEDLKGKYVYIDVWATWCGPCRAEIPYLQKIEEKYHDKNIAFVSISVDEDKDFEKWKKFVSDKKLGGTQLFADKNWKSDFIVSYGINSIPRFILIDTKGNIIDSDAKRPSDSKLVNQLDSLLK